MHFYAGDLHALELGSVDLYRIGADRNAAETICAKIIGCGRERGTGSGLCGCDLCSGDDCALRVLDRTRNHAGGDLRDCECGGKDQQEAQYQRPDFSKARLHLAS